jgi:hypothetical protein
MMRVKDFIYNQHDVVCNQKYGDNLPYSFHLKCVQQQGEKFLHLVEGVCTNISNHRSMDVSHAVIVKYSLLCHDAIEDARMTYNDVLELINSAIGNYKAAEMAANIVYCVTDEKGRSRKGRKNEKYYTELAENDLAVFVKLSDLAANMLYGKLTGSSMYEKYKEEFPSFKVRTYLPKYAPFFDYVEGL